MKDSTCNVCTTYLEITDNDGEPIAVSPIYLFSFYISLSENNKRTTQNSDYSLGASAFINYENIVDSLSRAHATFCDKATFTSSRILFIL